jgi:hypothetical protein
LKFWLTVRLIVVVLVRLPLVPTMVTSTVPVVAVLAAVNVTSVEDDDVIGLNDAVTPLGNPVAVNVTAPLKPPKGITETLEFPLAP